MFNFQVNDQPVHIDTDPEHTLLWVLRTNLNLTGTKYSCGEGYCGSCTVLVDNEPVRSCKYPIKDINNKKVITIEGLSRNGKLHPLQKAFIKHDALQCGFCTPGMILTALGLLLQNPNPTRKDIIDSLDDNLCRCGSYNRIIEAIQSASKEMRNGK